MHDSPLQNISWLLHRDIAHMYLWISPQEMASTLAQKHLRSIILNVSIKSELQKYFWRCQLHIVVNSLLCRLLAVKYPFVRFEQQLKLVATKKIWKPSLYINIDTGLSSVGVWWLSEAGSFIPGTSSSECGKIYSESCDTEPAYVIWHKFREVERNLALKMIPFATDSTESGWVTERAASVGCSLASWSKETCCSIVCSDSLFC